MANKSIKIVVLVGMLLLLAAVIDPLSAQCAMCKAAAESNIKTGGGDPRGLNAGILYMLLLPYLLVGSIGVWWWRNRRNENQQVTELSDKDFVQE